MNTSELWIAALLSIAAGVLLAGGAMFWRAWQQMRSGRVIDAMLAARTYAATGATGEEPAASTETSQPSQSPGPSRRIGLHGWRERLVALGQRWAESRWGEHLVADEDMRVLDQCGFNDARGRALFVMARVVLAAALPLLVWWWAPGHGDLGMMGRLLSAAAVGVMLPKLALSSRARRRRERVIDELPLLIDLLRLLQGVGLSIDQCLYVIVNDFHQVLPVLAGELGLANRHYGTGRTREQSLARLREVYDNDDLRAMVRLIVQVEQHGGAVQEPLQHFSDRLREQRRQTMKERIGKLTVKMTLTMMFTLLPALLLVIAGPAMLSLVQTIGHFHR